MPYRNKDQQRKAVREANRRYRKRHPDRVLASQRKYRAAHREELNAKRRVY